MQLAELLRAHDVYLAPSRDDPCSNALLEALACGLPAAYPAQRRPSRARRRGRARLRLRGGASRPCLRACATSWTNAAGHSRAGARRRCRPLPRSAARVTPDRRSRPRRLARSTRVRSRAHVIVAGRVASVRRRRRLRLVDRRRPRAARRPRQGGSVTRSRPPAGRASQDARRCSITTTSARCSLAGSTRRTGSGSATSTGVPARRATRSSTAPTRRCGATLRASTGYRSRTPRCTSSSSAPASIRRRSSGSRSGSISRAFHSRRRRRAAARTSLSIPATAFVVGSFLKDGVGLGDGTEPKLVKGPGRARGRRSSACASAMPELFVLLTGPARGYVRNELERLGHPVPPRAARTRATGWRAPTTRSTCTLVTSRQEGGPEDRARVDGGRRAARHDARRPGVRSRRRRRERACSPTSTTWRRSRPP